MLLAFEKNIRHIDYFLEGITFQHVTDRRLPIALVIRKHYNACFRLRPVIFPATFDMTLKRNTGLDNNDVADCLSHIQLQPRQGERHKFITNAWS